MAVEPHLHKTEYLNLGNHVQLWVSIFAEIEKESVR